MPPGTGQTSVVSFYENLAYSYIENVPGVGSGGAPPGVHTTYHRVTLLGVQVFLILLVEFVKDGGYHGQRRSV